MEKHWSRVVGTVLRAVMVLCVAVGLYALWRNAQNHSPAILLVDSWATLLFLVCLAAECFLEKRLGWKCPKALQIGIDVAAVLMLIVFCAAMWLTRP